MKKFLSLVLALVMTMSLVTISAGAKDFTDDETINYDEAVAVISAVKVVDGYPDGSFKPTTNLNRGQAAKIICNLKLGPTTAANLKADAAPFKDVAVDNVFAGYIAFCAKEGIVGGYADGTFKPTAPLTSYAFMKMLLGALGYDAEIEGYNAPNWSINVGKQALGIGLNAGLKTEFDGQKYVTREEACLYAFNTLKATMVDYDTKTTVNVGDASVTIAGSTAKPVSAANSNVQIGISHDGNVKDDGFVQFAEQYFPKLVKKADTDKFMRPANTWVYDKQEVGTYVDYTKLIETYKKAVSGKDVYDLLKAATIRDNELDVYVDGVTATGKEVIKKTDLVRSNNDDLGATGTGVLTEIYLDTDEDVITIVSINTWLAKASADYSEKKEYAPIKVYDGVKSTTTKNVDVKDVPAVKDVTKDTYYLTTISKKDVATGEIVSLVPAEVLSDSTVTKFSAGSNGDGTGLVTKLTTGGEEYKANKKAFYDNDILDTYNDGLLTNATYNVYLDSYGNFIGVDLFQGEKNYVFIAGYDLPTSHLSVKTADASAIFLDGTMDVIKVNVTDTNKNIQKTRDEGSANWNYFTAWGGTGASNLNQWYTYTVNESGTYTLKPCARMTKTVQPTAHTMDTAKVYVNDTESGHGTRVYGDDNSVFLTVEVGNVSDGILRGITEVTGTYTGVQSVDLEIDTSADAQAQGQIVTVYDSDNYIIGAVVIGEAKGSASNFAYILSTAKSEEKIGDTYYWEFEAIQGGEIKTLTAKSKYVSTIQALSKGSVQELRFDGDYVVSIKNTAKLYTDFTKYTDGEDIYMIDGSNGAKNTANKLTLQGRTLYVNANQKDVGLALVSDAKAIVIQKENGKEVKTEFTSVSEALSRLADVDDNPANGLQYSGKVIGALNKNGQGEWVVFISNTELKTGNQSSTTGGATGSISYTASATSLGTAVVNFTVKRPDWVPASADVTFDADLYVNGVYAEDLGPVTIDGGKTGVRVPGGFFGAYDANDKVTVKIDESSIEYSEVNVQYVDENGTDISGKLVKGYTKTLSTETAGSIAFALNTTDEATNKFTYAISGLTANVSTTTWTGKANASLSFSSKQAKGDGPVVVTIKLASALVESFKVDVKAADNGLTLDKYGSSTDTAKTLTVSFAAGSNTNLAAGSNFDVANVEVKLDSVPSDVYSYRVVIDGLGEVVLKDASKTPLPSKLIKIDGNLEITKDMIHVSVEDEKLAVTSATWTDTTVSLTFNEKVDVTTGETKGNYNWVDASTSGNTAAVYSAKVVGNIVTLTFTGKLDAGDTITLTTSIEQDGVGGNKTTAQVITLAADGKTTLA